MTASDLFALLPLLVLGGTAVLVMLVAAFHRDHVVAAVLTLAGLAAAFLSLFEVLPLVPRYATPLLVVDTYALFYVGLIVAATFAVALLAYGYLERHRINREEFYVLLVSAALGSSVLACSSHFASFFLGLEILSVGLYGLIAYLPMRTRPVEAAIKYLVLAGASAAFLLFGMALVYTAFGTMEFDRIAAAAGSGGTGLLVVAGTALLVTGIGFKLAVVPFHMWTPDVYEGAPAPVTALVATVSKGGMFALLVRYFSHPGTHMAGPVVLVFSIIAVASMVAGNLLALQQDNVKRILAYSSIAHLGYFLVAFQAGGAFGPLAATFYLTAYFVTILGAFGVVAVLSGEGGDCDRIEEFRGLFWRRPVLAVFFSAMLLSLAGIPVTAGFLGKFYVVAAGAGAALWPLVIVLVVTSTIGLFYYLRVLAVLYEQAPSRPVANVPAAGTLALVCLAVLLVWLGVYPSLFLDTIRAAIASLVA